jgi:hypothetical protein
MALFTTALGLYGGVLWSGELQGFIIHEMMPAISALHATAARAARRRLRLRRAEGLRHDISTEVFGRAYLEVRAGYFTH